MNVSVPPEASPTGPSLLATGDLPAAHALLVTEAAQALPERGRAALSLGSHRPLGRVVRDAVLLLLPGEPLHDVPADALVEAAAQAIAQLAELQNPSGTFRGGDNVDSPPDTAFTINDLAWARVAISGPVGTAGRRRDAADSVAARLLSPLLAPLDDVLDTVTPALLAGGVHTPNHRWEIASALARLWEARGVDAARARAAQWLGEGVDLQADGLFSERSANYAAHVSIPALLTLGRILERPELIATADRATHIQAALTDSRGLVETLASRRQDQFAPFDGGALHPWFRAHAARTGDALSARAARRTAWRADADAVLTLLTLATEDPSALAALPAGARDPEPKHPEVLELGDSALIRVDHGSSSTVLFGGTDTAAIGRVASGSSSRPTFARFCGADLAVRELRLSRDFFSVGPLRPGPPRRLPRVSGGPLRHALEEQVDAAYFQPLAPADHDPEGDYALEFNGRFAAAMDFSRRPTRTVSLATSLKTSISPGELELHWEFDGPETPLCLLLALDGGTLEPGPSTDASGRRVLVPDADTQSTARAEASCLLAGRSERLEITARGALGGRAFYDPGEAYTFLGATDEPDGLVLLIPASTSAPLTLRLRVEQTSAP